MLVSLKDSLKLIGITIVSFCAVFVCTFFLNFYLDAKALDGTFTDPNLIVLYDAQMAMAKFTCAISGGFLALIAVVMLVFYIKLYIDKNASNIGVLKAMGYSKWKIALAFSIFGLSVLLGTALGFGGGFIVMPLIYESMAIGSLEINVTFHPSLLFLLVFLPAAVFAVLSSVYAFIALRRPVNEMLKGKAEKIRHVKTRKKEKERSFLKEMCINTTFGRKSLAFFVAVACFCFSAMVQMSVSMKDLVPDGNSMRLYVFVIGVVLAVTTIFMAVTTLVNGNVKNIAMMKAFGYSMKECSLTVLGGYHLYAVIGFAVGTVYQYGLLMLMINLVFKDVAEIPEYSFSVPVFFITLAVFIVFYEAVMLYYSFRINKVSVKEVMTET